MRKLIIIFISAISIYSASAQKYTEIYINDANKVGLSWLNDVNNKKYENAYQLLSRKVKERYKQETWISLIANLMLEFGDLEGRTILQKEFQSQVKGAEDGFYVLIEYSSQYKNTKEHTEYLLLKQNDKAKWKIFDYNYEFQNKKEK